MGISVDVALNVNFSDYMVSLIHQRMSCLAWLVFELEICSIRCVHCNQTEDVCTSAASPFIAHQGMTLVQHSSAKNGCMLKAHGQTTAADALPHIVGVTIVLWRTQLENTATVRLCRWYPLPDGVGG